MYRDDLCRVAVDGSEPCTSHNTKIYEVVGGIASVRASLCLGHVIEIQNQHNHWKFNEIKDDNFN